MTPKWLKWLALKIDLMVYYITHERELDTIGVGT